MEVMAWENPTPEQIRPWVEGHVKSLHDLCAVGTAEGRASRELNPQLLVPCHLSNSSQSSFCLL